MKVVFFSNFMVPHQLAFCEEMQKLPGVEFTFVATQPFCANNVTAGFVESNEAYTFCLPAYRSATDMKRARRLCEESDVMLMGAAPEEWLRRRLHTRKLTFRVSERLYKPLHHTHRDPVAFLCTVKGNTIYKNHPLYLLAASAYAAEDYRFCGAFKGKAFRWGYFPRGCCLTTAQLQARKAQNAVPQILWAGRMIPLKHGEIALVAAAHCKKLGLPFQMIFAGEGPERARLEDQSVKLGLRDCVQFKGNVTNDVVLEYMSQADIFMATSDENEGWGAVVNEAMSAGCAVIASGEMGSVPYLIRDGENGITASWHVTESFNGALQQLLENPEQMRLLGAAAKETVSKEWSAEAAASNLVFLCEALQAGAPCPNIGNVPGASAD